MVYICYHKWEMSYDISKGCCLELSQMCLIMCHPEKVLDCILLQLSTTFHNKNSAFACVLYYVTINSLNVCHAKYVILHHPKVVFHNT